MSDSNLKVTLHLIQNNISPSDFNNQVDRLSNSGDHLVFMGDSVFDLTRLNQQFETIELSIYAIDSDINARALNHSLNKNINIINFEEFVYLTIKTNQVISW